MRRYTRGAMKEVLVDLVILVALVGIAAGRLPRLRMNRASMALGFAALLVALGAIGIEEALAAVDVGTIVLLLAMMLLVANLRIAGFFTAAGAALLGAARGPKSLLGLVVLASGFLSALFLNDTICLMLTPLVAELCLRARRDPLPYLVGLATAANVGSAATIIGNPQNMLIGASSGIEFGRFLLALAPPSVIGLGIVWLITVAAFPKEFGRGSAPWPAGAAGAASVPGGLDRRLAAKSLFAAGLMLVLLLLRVPPALAALVAAALLLFTRRIDPARVFAEVDFGLLVFFGGLFIITEAIARTGLFGAAMGAVLPLLGGDATAGGGGAGALAGTSTGGASLALFSGVTLVASNLVSNVPAVMLFRPLVPGFPEPERAWLLLALASTYAGNLTLLGSVANLIVAEGAKPLGIKLSFGAYLRVGLPVTLVTTILGTAWLVLI